MENIAWALVSAILLCILAVNLKNNALYTTPPCIYIILGINSQPNRRNAYKNPQKLCCI